jgi:hypothetical protein
LQHGALAGHDRGPRFGRRTRVARSFGASFRQPLMGPGQALTCSAPALRDRFLDALDQGDRALTESLAERLTVSGNPLPSAVCAALGLAFGSPYAHAARLILDQARGGRGEAAHAAALPTIMASPPAAVTGEVTLAPGQVGG